MRQSAERDYDRKGAMNSTDPDSTKSSSVGQGVQHFTGLGRRASVLGQRKAIADTVASIDHTYNGATYVSHNLENVKMSKSVRVNHPARNRIIHDLLTANCFFCNLVKMALLSALGAASYLIYECPTGALWDTCITYFPA